MKHGKNAPEAEKNAYKKTLRRGTRYRLPGVNIGILIAFVFLCSVIAVCTALILSGGKEGAPEETAPDVGITMDSAQTQDVEEGATVISLSADEVYRGDLILVNSSHEYHFPETREDVSVYDNKTSSYKVNDLEVTLSMTAITPFNRLMDDFYAQTQCRDVMVVSGFRTAEFQRQLYSDRVASEGVENAAKYVALPGQSEHHTGLAMDLSVYTDSGEGYYVRDYEKCEWLVENFENYGFILRYPEEKAQITGISYESWHYRYVGLPHSLIMKEKSMCLEEYIEYLKGLGKGRAIVYSGEASAEVDFTGEGYEDSYVIFYVSAEKSGNTKVSLPDGREYRISGDNSGGFIVTLPPKN